MCASRTTEKPADADTPKLDDPNMIKEANRFALLLVQSKDLILAWFDMLAKALKEKTYEVQIMDNFIAQKSLNKVDDFNTTYAYVIQAQQKLAAYKVYYWSGLYKTTRKPADNSGESQDGSVVSVVGSGSSQTAPFVSLAKAELIGYKFDNLVLSWDSADGLNATTGNLIFGVRNISGTATRTFAGTITEDGVKYNYAGILVDANSKDGQAATSKAPPQTTEDLKKLEYANQIISMVSQALFMAVNIGMLYKTGKELQELRGKIGSRQPTEEEQRQLDGLEANEKASETAADQGAASAEDIRSPVDEMSDDEFEIGSQDASPATETSELPDIDPPSDMEDLALSESEADLADEAIEAEVEAQGEEPNTVEGEGEGGEAEAEGGAMEDGEDVLTTGLEDFAEVAV